MSNRFNCFKDSSITCTMLDVKVVDITVGKMWLVGLGVSDVLRVLHASVTNYLALLVAASVFVPRNLHCRLRNGNFGGSSSIAAAL